MKRDMKDRKFRILDMSITAILLTIGLINAMEVNHIEHSGDIDHGILPNEEYGRVVVTHPDITIGANSNFEHSRAKSRTVRLVPEGKKVTGRYYQGPSNQYSVVFSFGRVNHSSSTRRLTYMQGVQNIDPKSLQPFMMATVYVNETGYWLGEESKLPNKNEGKGVEYGSFSDNLKEGEYLFVCGIYWHNNIHSMFMPKRITLTYCAAYIGDATEVEMSVQQGEKYIIGSMSKPYNSYREMIGYWTCGMPEIEIGEIHIIDAAPDYIKPCMTNESDSNPQTIYLEEGHPLQVNLDSTQTIASDVQYAFVTWRVNISLWLIKTYYPICAEYTLNHVHALYRWFTTKNAESRIRHHRKLFNSRNDRGRRDTFSTLVGGLGTGMGVINEADISSLRTKLADIATNSKKGFEVQRKINDVINNLQQDHVNTYIGVAKDFIQHFKELMENMITKGRNMSWALVCTQGQMELSSNIKLAIQSIYDGQWPFEWLSQTAALLPELMSFTHSKWWVNAWVGCNNYDFERCYASSFIPYTDSPLERMHKVSSIGILTGDSTLLHPRLEHPQVIRRNGRWKQVDISLCIQRNHDILCSPGQFRLVEDKCWSNSSTCILDGESISEDKAPVFYLGHQRVCFFLINTTNVSITTQHCSLVTSVARGAWCTLGEVTEIKTHNWDYIIPTVANLSIDLKYRTPVNLQALSLGMGKELGDWLMKFNRDEYLLMKLNQEKANATILVHHDQNELKEVTHLLENDAKGYWWELIFGHSNAANGILNYLIHPIVILLIVSLILSLLQIYMCCVTRYLYKKIQILTVKEQAIVKLHHMTQMCKFPLN
ncbi:uncharacterized protein ACNLHF_009232 [Anomaloglossus baeobatrachus]